jgi:hypothetical protein
VYVEPSQILLHSRGNLLFIYQTAYSLILVCGLFRKEVRDYKLNSCQLICMKILLTKDTERQRMTQNYSEEHG